MYARTSGGAQDWARNLLTTVGRGGNAQAVRDEILNIMHRNKVGALCAVRAAHEMPRFSESGGTARSLAPCLLVPSLGCTPPFPYCTPPTALSVLQGKAQQVPC